MDEIRLRTYDGVAVAGFLILPALFTTGLSQLARQNAAAGWLAMLISFAVMAALFIAVGLMMKKHPGKNIIQIAGAAWKPLGPAYGAMLAAYFCFFTGVSIRESAEILKIYGLSLTPIFVVAGLIVLTGVLMNFFGGRAIIKSAGFFFVIIVLGIVMAILLGISHYNPDHLAPALGNGLPATAASGLWHTSLLDGVAVLFLFAPAFKSAGKMMKSGVIALAVATAAWILLFMCFIMLFSAPMAAGMMSGFIEMGKASYFNHFFSRFEPMFLFFLIFSSAIQASIGLFAARSSLSSALGLKAPRALAAICGSLAALAAAMPESILDLTRVYLPVIRQYGVVFMAGFPLLVLIMGTVGRALRHEKG